MVKDDKRASKCIIYAIRENGDVEQYSVAHNAQLGFLSIWLNLGNKYDAPLDFDNPNPTWDSIAKMNRADRFVMAMTFDAVVIYREQFNEFLLYFNDYVNRWGTGTLYKIFSALKKAEKDESIIGVCFNATDANDNPWVVIRNGEKRKYNIYKDEQTLWGKTKSILDFVDKKEK